MSGLVSQTVGHCGALDALVPEFVEVTVPTMLATGRVSNESLVHLMDGIAKSRGEGLSPDLLDAVTDAALHTVRYRAPKPLMLCALLHYWAATGRAPARQEVDEIVARLSRHDRAPPNVLK